MEKYLLEMFGISLLLTLVLELPVAYCFGYRSAAQLLLVMLVNVLTNPAAVLLHWLGISQFPIEIAVIFVEMGIYVWFSKDGKWNVPYPAFFAVAANCISWSTGLLIQWIGG